MRVVIRQTGSRRMGLPVDYPLTGDDDVLVSHDRRRLPDRRKLVHDINDVNVILLKISGDKPVSES